MSSRREIWEQRYGERGEGDPQPCAVLREHAHLLPASGEALDLACGRGGNALWLARQGLRTSAWDFSANAIDELDARAARLGLALLAQQRDVEVLPPPPLSFDVIAVSRFLARSICPAIAEALRPGGLLFYQTFVRERVGDAGPANPDYRLADNELLALFAGLRVRAYRDEGRAGDTALGVRDEAWLVAQRPPQVAGTTDE